MSIQKILPFLLCCLSIQSLRGAHAAGIRVRFLASPPEDSVVRYDVWRRDSTASAAVKVGSISAGAGADTLSFPDATARRGVAYHYCLRAVNAAGLESDPSDSSRVALPRLDLPGSAIPETGEAGGAGMTRLRLGPAAHPLRGHAPLVLSLADSSRLRLVHDTVSGSVHFLSPAGRADTVTAVVRASYHGKFSDQDTVLVVVAGRSSAALLHPHPPHPPREAVLAGPALRRAPDGGAMVLAVPSPGRVRLLRPDGRLVPPR